jgi:hypothetical protein
MCTLEESNECYRYIGFPGYNPHVKLEKFYQYFNKEEADHDKKRTDHEKTLLINARRIFNIAEKGQTYEEREDLARVYFDQVHSTDPKEEEYVSGETLIQIYILGAGVDGPVYGYRPIKRNRYLFNRLKLNGCLEGKLSDLKKRIDWFYLHTKTDKKNLHFLCAPSFYRKDKRDILKKQEQKQQQQQQQKLIYDQRLNYSWAFWPDLD